MQQVEKIKTVQALNILEKTNNQVNSFLKDINAGNAGYREIHELFSQIQADITDAKERSRKETIRIGILGGRGSGKSTLANALMGETLLPESATIFGTNIPTIIKYTPQYFLQVESELEEHCHLEINIAPKRMKDILSSICKESKNRNNSKKISSITVGVPRGLLDSKEIVDVPGFTKGSPLHQAFAERYAKYYCDVCLVLINNPESVEINSHEGLEALAWMFQNRLDSTGFILNKCDQASTDEMDFIEDKLREYLKNEKLHFFQVSSKNSLANDGDQYQFNNLLSYLSFLSSRKAIVLVKALLERLIANFTSLRDLCDLSGDDLDCLYKDIKNLLNIEFDSLLTQLNNSIHEKILPNDVPKVDLSKFDLPPIGISGPNEYRKQLVDSLDSQYNQNLNEYVEKYQADIYHAFNSRFEEKLVKFNQVLQHRVKEFEDKFGISSLILMPKLEKSSKIANLNPPKIQKLKPPGFRLWAEKILPGFLVRDLNFWSSPISIKVGFFSIKLIIPIGVKRKGEMASEIQKNISEEAVKLINEYIYASLDKLVNELSKTYTSVVTEFVNDWRKCLRDYLRQIEIAKVFTEPASLKKIDDFVNEIRQSSEEIANLMSQE